MSAAFIQWTSVKCPGYPGVSVSRIHRPGVIPGHALCGRPIKSVISGPFIRPDFCDKCERRHGRMTQPKKPITQERLKEVMDYDPATGVFTWKIDKVTRKAGQPAGTMHGEGYWMIGIDGTRYLAHRLVWLYVHGEWPLETIDHRRGNRLDNRIGELRKASLSQNAANGKMRATNRSGFRGVVAKCGRWTAYITVNYRQRCLGMFNTPEEASEAYKKAAAEAFGEFATA